jgi:hypothetical protein
MLKVVATGTWLYDDSVPTVVRVIETDRDFWFDIGDADKDLSEGEVPQINPIGLVYYLRTKPGWEPGQAFWPDSQGFMTIEDAKAAAETQVPGTVSWA